MKKKNSIKKLEKEIKKGKTKHAALNDAEGAGKCPAGGPMRKRQRKGNG